ncbi:MAG: Glu/Leu/Phe/Val family dehydrogenase [Solirubrobacterales bacterium]
MAVAVRTRPAAPAHEEVVFVRGPRSGVPMGVAIHSTALGPALGGLRIWHYPRAEDAERDALRLSKGMTLKAAAAGLDLGGGKGVICAPRAGLLATRRRDALLDFGDLVESLGGRYVTAEDVGVTPRDIAVVAERTAHVTGLPPEDGGSGDPSPVTAVGVAAAMLACARERWGGRALAGAVVAIVGVGHVGGRLARLLRDRGCELLVSDVDPSRRAVAEALGARWIGPGSAMRAPADILAPCALGGAITHDGIAGLGCEIVCGAANNQLADDSLAGELAAAGVLYGPDFIANAGGLINVYREIGGYSEAQAMRTARGIEQTMAAVLERARHSGTTPLAAARALAGERLGAVVAD